MSLVADGLVADEDPLLDDRELAGLDAVVIVSAGREAFGSDAVAVEIDDVGADAEFAQLVGRQERRAGVVGLVSERTIKLGRVADRLVNREAQVGRQEHEIQDARRNRWCLQMGDGLFADSASVAEHAGPLDGLVAGTDRVRQVGARLDLRPTSTAVAVTSGEIWYTCCSITLPSDETKNRSSRRASIEPITEKTPATLCISRDGCEQVELLLDGNGERVGDDLGPVSVAVGRGRRELDRLQTQRGIGPRDRDGLDGGAGDRVACDFV